jgi:ribosomal protein S18 acetylase RimI-like enzyme
MNMDIQYEFLSNDRFPEIHRTFMEAFADYYVDTSGVTETMLYNRAIKNGVDFGLSVGAVAGDEMVGVTIVGCDRWKGVAAAFDIGTGIVPDYRGKGIAKRMFEFAVPELRNRGVEKFVLEVIQENEPAIKAYKGAGFNVTREFDCFNWKPNGAPQLPHDIRPVDREVLSELESHLDWRPSWENSFASIRRIPDDVMMYGAFVEDVCAGVIVYYPLINWITTLVVKREYRRRGVATALLAHFARKRPEGIDAVKLINIDHSDTATLALLANVGVEPIVQQFEMELDL